MILKKQVRHILVLSIVMSVSALNRLKAPIIKGTPYGLDFYEFVSYVFSANTPSDVLRLPHGPIFYFFLFVFKGLGIDFFLTLGTYVLPVLFSATIFPLYFLSKKIFKSEDVGYLSLLIAGSVNMLVHQTGATVIPEALGLMFAGLSFISLLDSLEKSNLRNFITSTILLLLISLSHHLTTLVFYTSLLIALFPFLLLPKTYSDEKPRLLIPLSSLFLSALLTILYWYNFTFNYTLKLVFYAFSVNHWLIFLMISCGFLVMLIFPYIVRFLSRPFKISIMPWAMALLAFGLFVIIISSCEFRLFLTPVIFYGLPMMLTVVPLSWVGLRSLFQVEKSYIKKSLMLAQILVPNILSTSFLMFRELSFMSYRMISLSLFFSSPFVAYGTLKTIHETPKKARGLLVLVFACLIFSLSLTSTPSKEFLCGIEESYSREELNAARLVVNSLKDEFAVDADIRFGNLLLFFSEGKLKNIVGNRMYFQNISDNLLVQISRGGVIHLPNSTRLIVVTRSMLKEEGGVVVLPFYMDLKPIELKDIDILNDYEGSTRALDYQDVTVYVIEWRSTTEH